MISSSVQLFPVSSSFKGLPSQSTAQPKPPRKMTRILVRENEYSLYSHVPRVLTHALAIMSHFTPPAITGPKPSFFPSPDLVVDSPSKYYVASNHTVDNPLPHSKTHFHSFTGPVKRAAVPKEANADKKARPNKKLSRGQRLAKASKLAKALKGT
ncbi:hypothetical protein BJ741DRAFT_652265 [Chytriomyces cf. hyalinus JEL632]|nr:hypothetical protein BJ741DRAFT_652265 [Chytriomyces cf. hyalinus JEL632]